MEVQFFDAPCCDVCVCERECDHSVFQRSTGKNNSYEGQTKPDMAVCFVLMFIPYVFVPAGRSCF